MQDSIIGDENFRSRLTQIELDVISCNKSVVFEEAMYKCIQLLAVNSMQSSSPYWMKAQYECFVAYGYLTFRGAAYASQAESHANEVRSMLVNRAATELNEQMDPTCGGDTNTQSLNQTLLLIMLLTHYTLAKAQTILKKDKEAVKSAETAELILNRLLAMERDATSSQTLPSSDINQSPEYSAGETSAVFVDLYPSVTSPMLRPGGGFYPSLKELEIRIQFLLGRCHGNQKKRIMASKFYQKALDLIQEQYGENCKEAIPVYYALAQLAESGLEKQDMEEAICFYRKVYKIAKPLADQERSDINCIEVLLVVHRLSLAYLKSEGTNATVLAENLLKDTIDWIQNPSNAEEADTLFAQSQYLAQSEHERLLSLSYRLLQTQNVAENTNTMDHSEIKRKLTDLICLLRSTLVKIYSESKRLEEATEMVRQNLTDQQFTHGLYSPAAVTSKKILLSISMVTGNVKDTVNQAKECLAMEEFTFGHNSKQACKTREILKALGGFQGCEVNPQPRFK